LPVSTWLRAVRTRFLLASAIAVTNGLAISWAKGFLHPLYAILTYVGIVCGHISVDLLNDYFDYRSGIDLLTVRTPFSGGTGVLPEGLLKPESVYRAGLASLALGSAIGVYLAIVRGWLVFPLLAFAAVSIYLYSTSIANRGLGEVFICVKGALVVLGTFYVQTLTLAAEPLLAGIIMGLLSASVLYVNEFPDYEADRSKGRLNLVVRLGRRRAAQLYPLFHLAIYLLIIAGVLSTLFPPAALITFAALPLPYRAAQTLRKSYEKPLGLIPGMASSSLAARVIGILLALSFITPYSI